MNKKLHKFIRGYRNKAENAIIYWNDEWNVLIPSSQVLMLQLLL